MNRIVVTLSNTFSKVFWYRKSTLCHNLWKSLIKNSARHPKTHSADNLRVYDEKKCGDMKRSLIDYQRIHKLSICRITRSNDTENENLRSLTDHWRDVSRWQIKFNVFLSLYLRSPLITISPSVEKFRLGITIHIRLVFFNKSSSRLRPN